MAEHCGVIQSITRLRRNIYKLTFRVHTVGAGDDGEIDPVGGLPHMFEAEIRLTDRGFTAVADEALDEFLTLLAEYPDAALIGKENYGKWIVGRIAGDIFDRLRDDMTLSSRSWSEIKAYMDEKGSAGR